MLPEDSGEILSSIDQRVRAALSPGLLAFIEQTARLANERGWRIYLVGGYVRDLLLSRLHYDLDISVEGDAIELARELEAREGAHVEATHRFLTVYLQTPDRGDELDLVTARRESYPWPGALPVVERGAIYDDLARRDFTINAMAIAVRPDGAGPLIDPHNGLGDLKAGLVCVLHDRSFSDDPTRIPRAVKYAARLGFRIHPHTLELILQGVRDGALRTVSMDRLSREIQLIMQEPKSAEMLARLEKLGVLRAIHLEFSWPYPADSDIANFETQGHAARERLETNMAILGSEFAGDAGEARRLGRELGFGARNSTLMHDAAVLAALWPKLGTPDLRPSQVYDMLKDLEPVALEAYARIRALAKDEVAYGRLLDYLDRQRHIKLETRGDYIRSLSVPPGPVYRRALTALLEARLDGRVSGREGEEHYLREWLAREGISFHT